MLKFGWLLTFFIIFLNQKIQFELIYSIIHPFTHVFNIYILILSSNTKCLLASKKSSFWPHSNTYIFKNHIVELIIPYHIQLIIFHKKKIFLILGPYSEQKRMIILIIQQKEQSEKMQIANEIHEMKGQQFPFGVFNVSENEGKKMFIKKRYVFRNAEEQTQLKLKIEKLKNISHKNTINLRSIEESSNFIDLYYPYVPTSFEDAFLENSNKVIKEMHKQFIQLAIFLAKSCINTSFNPSRCGVVINQDKRILKYYLPLHEITITSDRSVLERQVQLFNVQSMHYIDTISTQILNSTINESSSQRTFKNRCKLSSNNKPSKNRRDSQPNSFNMAINSNRKLSNCNTKQSQIRKLSTLSKQFSQLSEMFKKRQISTKRLGNSFNTFNSIVNTQNQSMNSNIANSSRASEMKSKLLKRCLSQNYIDNPETIGQLVQRSKRAIQNLQMIRENISSLKLFYNIIKDLKSQN